MTGLLTTLPYPILPYPILSYPILPYPTLPCPALPCPALPCPALPCPALPCPALPCPALHNYALMSRVATGPGNWYFLIKSGILKYACMCMCVCACACVCVYVCVVNPTFTFKKSKAAGCGGIGYVVSILTKLIDRFIKSLFQFPVLFLILHARFFLALFFSLLTSRLYPTQRHEIIVSRCSCLESRFWFAFYLLGFLWRISYLLGFIGVFRIC